MLVVLPVCDKDVHLAELNLTLVRHLEGKIRRHRLLISCEENFEGRDRVLAWAHKAFAQVDLFTYSPYTGPKEWPRPQNFAWQKVAKLAGIEEPWLWWEQDAVPLKKGWLDILEKRYQASGKTFMGHFVSSMGHMNGVAIWPPHLEKHVKEPLFCRGVAFDWVAKDRTVPHMHKANDLMVHHLKENGPRSFKTREEVRALGSAVLFHGCEDGSLHKLVMECNRKLQLLPQKEDTGDTPPDAQRIVVASIVDNPRTRDESKRIHWALNSWRQLKEQHVDILVMRPPFLRNSLSLQDKRRLPYLKDLLIKAINKTRPGDLILLTNADIGVHVTAPKKIRERMLEVDALSVCRTEIRDCKDMSIIRESIAATALEDVGRDAFILSHSWLTQNVAEFPDFFWGECEWDLCLYYLLRHQAGLESTKESFRSRDIEVELEPGYLYHVNHDSTRTWDKEPETSPAKLHNQRRSKEFLHGLGVAW